MPVNVDIDTLTQYEPCLTTAHGVSMSLVWVPYLHTYPLLLSLSHIVLNPSSTYSCRWHDLLYLHPSWLKYLVRTQRTLKHWRMDMTISTMQCTYLPEKKKKKKRDNLPPPSEQGQGFVPDRMLTLYLLSSSFFACAAWNSLWAARFVPRHMVEMRRMKVLMQVCLYVHICTSVSWQVTQTRHSRESRREGTAGDKVRVDGRIFGSSFCQVSKHDNGGWKYQHQICYIKEKMHEIVCRTLASTLTPKHPSAFCRYYWFPPCHVVCMQSPSNPRSTWSIWAHKKV